MKILIFQTLYDSNVDKLSTHESFLKCPYASSVADTGKGHLAIQLRGFTPAKAHILISPYRKVQLVYSNKKEKEAVHRILKEWGRTLSGEPVELDAIMMNIVIHSWKDFKRGPAKDFEVSACPETFHYTLSAISNDDERALIESVIQQFGLENKPMPSFPTPPYWEYHLINELLEQVRGSRRESNAPIRF